MIISEHSSEIIMTLVKSKHDLACNCYLYDDDRDVIEVYPSIVEFSSGPSKYLEILNNPALFDQEEINEDTDIDERYLIDKFEVRLFTHSTSVPNLRPPKFSEIRLMSNIEKNGHLLFVASGIGMYIVYPITQERLKEISEFYKSSEPKHGDLLKMVPEIKFYPWTVDIEIDLDLKFFYWDRTYPNTYLP